ncbi:hypothetical protein [Acinetobacter sp. CFCC 10889]|uniref:hypothetical protein n=1 Tax=Acinetobacter sp. CFCC 10889 TaxID=1775557 RepID=UPI000DCFB4AC|nr:hypothetical protein [Acinetobacter sp. CFCC 10889]
MLKNGYFIDDIIQITIGNIKKILLSENIYNGEYNFDAMLEGVDQLAIDFEEADDKEAVLNYFIFALSTLIYYFVAEIESSLDGVCEDIIEFYRNIAQNDYFEIHEINGVMLSTDQTNEIENNQLLLKEKNYQEKDLEYAKNVIDWSLVKI